MGTSRRGFCIKCGKRCFGSRCRECYRKSFEFKTLIKSLNDRDQGRRVVPKTKDEVVNFLVKYEGFTKSRAEYLVDWFYQPVGTPLN